MKKSDTTSIRIDMGGDEGLLSLCERGKDTSVDTSMTLEGSLVSSSSSNEDAFDYTSPVIHSRNTCLAETIRHRQRSVAPEDSGSFRDDDVGDCESYSTSEEHDYCEYDTNDRYKLEHFLMWWRKRVFRPRHRCRKLMFSVPVLLLTALALASLAHYHIQKNNRWKLPSPLKTATILRQLREQPVQRGMTLRIRGGRAHLLQQSLDQHAHCPIVTLVQIDWTTSSSHDDRVPDVLLDHPSFKAQDLATKPRAPTQAVMLLDESILLSCQDLETSWNEWQHDPSRLVGFLPVFFSNQRSTYSFMSDSALLLHRFYLRAQEHAVITPAPCQHLALSAWVLALSAKGPIAMLSSSEMVVQTATPDYCHWRALQVTGLSNLPLSTTTFVGRQPS
jgi:hypothetical protein